MTYHAETLQALARSNLYGLLSRVTGTEIDQEFLAALRQPGVLEALREAGADLAPVVGTVADALLLEQLATAYSFLFLLTVNPHESVQCGEGQLWGNRTVAAAAFLDEAGLAVPGERSLLPDHISMELAVMQRLSADEAASLAAADLVRAGELQALQQRYLKEHLGRWGVTFFGASAKAANHEFYRQLSQVGFAFLRSELAEFGL